MRKLLFSRLGRGTLAGIYAQFIQLAIQLISVPVLTSHWGLAGYGAWVLLFTVPQMLAMADLGLTAAGANAMTAAAAQGHYERAARIHTSLRWTSLLMALTVGSVIGLYVLWLRPHTLDFAQPFTHGRAWVTVLAMLGYTVLAMQNAVTGAGFRAADAFATWQTVYDTCLLTETLAALTVAAVGYGPEEVALTYLGCRVLFSGLLGLFLRRLAPWSAQAGWQLDGAEIKRLLKPALAAFMLPAAQAITLQGSVMAIGAMAGPAAVPAFSTLRTISRTALQFTYRFNFASMPRYTVHHATGNEAGKSMLVMANLAVAVFLLLPAAPVLFVLGKPIIALWTHGVVHPSSSLLALMLAAMVLNGLWVPMSNLICAINEHARFTYFYLFCSLLSVALGAWAVRRDGVEGMGMAMVAQEIVMAAWIWRMAIKQDMIRWSMIQPALHKAIARLRSKGAKQA
ncbi:lipopolysaccharide biosynthesis protein [Novosphingobium sp. KACC 22771]|uniref:lipopolysaccharide biosynthesis protein n=1 Tax=Novosphingobium sp. KACC 22771 TaxID=3025670 RepID=UPI0023670450|nr:lipopolysaccharide biosynthesis protein [Novosphingobium sp. KACC 22771]WDF72874.1 lipopolysaccharide biosynthesis protein [Novosphingobium sp. KACC 22771]